jgi:RNA polymerase sporulation-specific sigma factor
MQDADALFHAHLSLADRIVSGYANIPGVTPDDIRAVARAALHRAACAFDPARGTFEPFAAQAIRNALNTLHQKEARHARQHVAEADLVGHAITEGSTSPSQRLPDVALDVVSQVRSDESRRVLEKLLAELPARTRQILALIAQGHSYAEIGEKLGVSKQAVHKTAAAAMDHIRSQLAAQGFTGLDSQGLLRTSGLPGDLAVCPVDDFPSAP